MEEKPSRNRSLVVVSLLLLSVVAILIVLFVMRPTEEREGIVLPGPATESVQEQRPEVPSDDGFLQIHADNVISVLDSLKKPEYYYQEYQVTVSSAKSSSTKTVAIWVNGPWIHGEVRDERFVKSVFTDGTDAWIWYDQDLNPVLFHLSDSLLLEDLLGIPNFNYQETIRQSRLLEAEYRYEEDTTLQYIYVSASDQNDSSVEYRFSLDNGLLFSCTVRENKLVSYEVLQTSFEQLAYGDQAFERRFCLPDGTVPFTAEARTLPQ